MSQIEEELDKFPSDSWTWGINEPFKKFYILLMVYEVMRIIPTGSLWYLIGSAANLVAAIVMAMKYSSHFPERRKTLEG